MNPSPQNFTEGQAQLRERYGIDEAADVHCHCLPGIDDGPADLADAIALCNALAANGLTIVVATPHQMGRFDGINTPDLIRSAAAALGDALLSHNIPLQIELGADVRVDERLPELLAAGQILTVAGGRYMLLELPTEAMINPTRLIRELIAGGHVPVITHPERYPMIVRRPELLTDWVADGAVLQITAGSLLGQFGPAAEKAAWSWLGQLNMSALVATDAHNVTTRRPCMAEAAEAISQRISHVTARRVCFENPLHVLRSEDFSKRRGAAAARSAR